MTIDFSSTPDDSPTNTESKGSMFAPVPAWERGKKRRMFGGSARSTDSAHVAEEPRSFAAESETETLAGDQRAYAFDPIGPADESAFAATTESEFAGTPSYASVTARRKTSVAPVAIAAGIVLLGGLAATGWYMSQNHTTGLAELTPGSTATTTTTTVAAGDQAPTADAATPQAALPAASASASAPAAAAPVAHTTTMTTTTHSSAPASVTHRTAVARAKAPATRSATDAGTNAVATLPATPQPYQGAAAAAAPTPPAPTPAPPLVLTIPPATTQAAPAETAPAPTQTAPTQTAPPSTTATPPTQPPSQ
jgi:hypothetical protein